MLVVSLPFIYVLCNKKDTVGALHRPLDFNTKYHPYKNDREEMNESQFRLYVHIKANGHFACHFYTLGPAAA